MSNIGLLEWFIGVGVFLSWPIHLSKQLVDSLPGVWVHGRLDPFPTHAVQFINEDHTRSIGFSLPCREKITEGKIFTRDAAITPLLIFLWKSCQLYSIYLQGENGEAKAYRMVIFMKLFKNPLKRFLMRLAPTPTNISSNSDPEA